jgi:hypothetical protein
MRVTLHHTLVEMSNKIRRFNYGVHNLWTPMNNGRTSVIYNAFSPRPMSLACLLSLWLVVTPSNVCSADPANLNFTHLNEYNREYNYM